MTKPGDPMIEIGSTRKLIKLAETTLTKIRASFGSYKILFKRFNRCGLKQEIADNRGPVSKKFLHTFGGNKVLFHQLTHDGLARLKEFKSQISGVLIRPERGPPGCGEEDQSSTTSASMTSSSPFSSAPLLS